MLFLATTICCNSPAPIYRPFIVKVGRLCVTAASLGLVIHLSFMLLQAGSAVVASSLQAGRSLLPIMECMRILMFGLLLPRVSGIVAIIKPSTVGLWQSGGDTSQPELISSTSISKLESSHGLMYLLKVIVDVRAELKTKTPLSSMREPRIMGRPVRKFKAEFLESPRRSPRLAASSFSSKSVE
jgi:hypothetical protein